MDFELTDDQRMIREMVRTFAQKEIVPIAGEMDKTEEFPWPVIRKMAELGILGLPFPDKYGGAGADTVSYAIAVEEISRASGSVGITLAAHISLGTYPIYAFGTEEQKHRFLTPLTTGQGLGAFGLTEPGAGSDAGAIQTTAVKKGDTYVINGSKCYITNGKYADLLCVLATVDKSQGTRGISCFYIPRDTPGIRVGREEDKMGHRALSVAELFFEDVEISAKNLIGKEGEGFKLAMTTLDRGRVNITAVCTAIAQKALDEALKWARERHQFGEPIGNFQGIHFMLADMNALIMACRAMYLQVGWMLDQNKRCSTEAAAAKCFASDAAMKVTTDAVQILAGSGYMKGSIVEKLMRDAKLTQIFEGTNQINRIVSGRGILRQASALF
jgi:butyryl-CoA dehydrogenase